MANPTELEATIAKIIEPGKGILAADESTPTITKRFKAVGIESSDESRRAYRSLLFTAPEADAYLSGVILFEETLGQKADDGTPLGQVLVNRGILPGIKVDKGTTPRPGAAGDDDGVLLVPTLADDDETSLIGVIDAKSMQPLASIHAPQVVPFGFHAAFVQI